MRALILAAGMGTRMGSLGRLCPKPALPVRGLPLVASMLRLLDAHGVREIMFNLHHLPEDMREAAEQHTPAGVSVLYSHEKALLGTGGAVRRVADFLRESELSLVLGGDMLLDMDLTSAIERHRQRNSRVSLILRDDERSKSFGTIGIDREGCVRRIGQGFDLGGEHAAGVFVSVRILSSEAYDDLPDSEAFEDLRDWFAPRLRRGARDIHADLLSPTRCIWQPVGTPEEYLLANFERPQLSYDASVDSSSEAESPSDADLIIGAGATLGEGVQLRRAVIWDGETVPAGFTAHDGVFAGGRFHPAWGQDNAVASGRRE